MRCLILKKMLDYMEKTYSIDSSRIYVTGHSNGSHMTQELARRIPERFAAFAPTGAMDGWDPQVRHWKAAHRDRYGLCLENMTSLPYRWIRVQLREQHLKITATATE